MYYVLKHRTTSQIATGTLINVYDLPYYGTKFWLSKEEAEAEYEDYLQQNGEDASQWEIMAVEEMTLKLFNVKLQNNASLRLYINEQGKAIAK